jgi:hypothetical protein
MKHSDLPKKKLSQAKIKTRKKQLRRLNEVEKSWRNVHHKYYPEISYQVLNRFATDKTYVPADVKICDALDLYADPNPYRGLPKWYKRTPEALNFFNTKREQIKVMSDEAKRQRDEVRQ